MRIYPFSLDTSTGAPAAELPIFFQGKPLGNFSCRISLRAAGDMSFRSGTADTSRTAFFQSQRIEPERVFACSQVHSREVVQADGRRPWISPTADGLASNSAGTWLSVTVADCLPVFLADTESGAFALLHSGWKGTGIVGAALELMARTWGTRPEAVAAVLGPCIRACCYTVDEDRARLFEQEFGGPGEYPLGPVVDRASGGPRLDLQAANARLLAAAGVKNIAVCETCTFTDERLGSFRREGPEKYTRMVAVAGRLSEEP